MKAAFFILIIFSWINGISQNIDFNKFDKRDINGIKQEYLIDYEVDSFIRRVHVGIPDSTFEETTI